MNYYLLETLRGGGPRKNHVAARWWTVGCGVIVSVVLTVGALFVSRAGAEEPVSAELVWSIPRANESERSLLVGIRYTIAPGWHLYWKNPGESGLPTKVDWELPAGFEAESVQWPRPSRFSPPGQVKMFGYEQEVVLVSRLVPPAGYWWGDPIEVTAKTSWLGCSPKSCVRGAKELRDQLSEERSKSLAFFEGWIRQVPSPASLHSAVRAVNPIGDAGLEVLWQEKVSEVEVVSEVVLPPGGWQVGASSQGIGDRGGVSTITITAGGGADPRPLPLVLLFRRADGSSDGIALTIPPKKQEG